MSLEPLLQQLISWAKSQREIVALYLYGSHVQDRANALSDIDVAVLARNDLDRGKLWRLEDDFASQWLETIDVCVLNLSPLPFQFEVTANGRRIWAADLGAVAKFESLIWRRYWDLRPRLERDWEQYVRHLMEQKGEVERQQYQATLDKVRAVHRRVRETAIGYADKLQK
jgi:predicted nucleotidyltransferase